MTPIFFWLHCQCSLTMHVHTDILVAWHKLSQSSDSFFESYGLPVMWIFNFLEPFVLSLLSSVFFKSLVSLDQLDRYRLIELGKKKEFVCNPFSNKSPFLESSPAVMLLLIIVVLTCILASFHFRCFSASSSRSSVHPSIHLSFVVLQTGRGWTDQWDGLKFQNHLPSGFYRLTISLSHLFFFSFSLHQQHLKSLGCGSRPPVRRRECRGATGWRTAWWSGSSQSGARPALHRSLVADGTTEWQRR